MKDSSSTISSKDRKYRTPYSKKVEIGEVSLDQNIKIGSPNSKFKLRKLSPPQRRY